MSTGMATSQWYTEFSAYAEDQKRLMKDLAPIMNAYETLREKDAVSTRRATNMVSGPGPSGSNDSSLLNQKSKQIESQQFLLRDLQTQLSSQEIEIRDFRSKLTISMSQASQLQKQLEATTKLLQDREIELVALRNDLRAMENGSSTEQIGKDNATALFSKSDPVITGAALLASRLPRRVIKETRLGEGQMDYPVQFMETPRSSPSLQSSLFVGAGTTVMHVTMDSKPRKIFSHSAIVTCGAVDSQSVALPNSTRLLVGTADADLFLVSPLSSDPATALKGHTGKVKSCGFVQNESSAGHLAFSAATDRTVKLWDLNRQWCTRSVPCSSQITGAASNSSLIYTCHQNGELAVWSAGQKICQVSAFRDSACNAICVSPDGKYAVLLGKDHDLLVFDVSNVQAGPVHTLAGCKSALIDVSPAISSDSLIVSVCGSDFIHSWELATGTPLGTVRSGNPTCIAWTRDVCEIPVGEDVKKSEFITADQKGVVKWWGV